MLSRPTSMDPCGWWCRGKSLFEVISDRSAVDGRIIDQKNEIFDVAPYFKARCRSLISGDLSLANSYSILLGSFMLIILIAMFTGPFFPQC